MAVLTKQERRKEMAKAHAKHAHLCGICGRVAFGNGGWSSHLKTHKRELSKMVGKNFMQEPYSWIVQQFDEIAKS